MKLNKDDVWPETEPIGTFDIEWNHSIQGYPEANGHIIFICPNNKRCSVLMGKSPIDNSKNDKLSIWGFDGNINNPTLTPSINCLKEKEGKLTSGCGWHGFIIGGIIR